MEGEVLSFLFILGNCPVGGSSVGGRLSSFLKNEFRVVLYPKLSDPPKVGHQDVIKMINAHFYSGNIWVIIFHKFSLFQQANSSFIRFSAGMLWLIFLVLIPEGYPLLQCFCLLMWIYQLLPVVHQLLHVLTAPGPWNCPDTQFPAQQALPPTVESFRRPFEPQRQATMDSKPISST